MKAVLVRVMASAAVAAAVLWAPVGAQDRLKGYPGYEQYQRMLREIPASVKLGSLAFPQRLLGCHDPRRAGHPVFPGRVRRP